MSYARFIQLDHYRLLGNTGLRVSPFCLGTMTFGNDWGWGSDRDESRRIFDLYCDRGGNFIDTASHYTNGTSETFVGEFIGNRRAELIIGTHYSVSTHPHDRNAAGNHPKNMVQSLESSLRRLQTDYVDVFWLHCWDFTTSVETVLRGLDHLVQSGKVLHVGIANTPVWKISQAQAIAELRGMAPFAAIQVEYNLIDRTAERDLIPMSEDLQLGVLAVSPLAGGLLSGKYNLAAHSTSLPPVTTRIDRTSARTPLNALLGRINDRSLAIVLEVMEVANRTEYTPAQVALNWLFSQEDIVCSTVLGVRTVQQLQENLSALDFSLDVTQMSDLDMVSGESPSNAYSYIRRSDVREVIYDSTQIVDLTQQRYDDN